MTKIIGFAGEKTSGKNTIANVFSVVALQKYGLGSDLKIDNKSGKIKYKDEYVDANQLNPQIVTCYALADALKEICVDVLGLDHHKVYGTNAQKDELTDCLWEDMPGVITNKRAYTYLEKAFHENKWREPSWPWVYHKKGNMTSREVMQYVGSNIFRKINPQVWIDSCKKRISKDNPEFALITDLRFPNEILVFSKEGVVVGMEKKSASADKHISEQVDLTNCKYLVKNQGAKNVKDLIECMYSTFGKNKDLLTI